MVPLFGSETNVYGHQETYSISNNYSQVSLPSDSRGFVQLLTKPWHSIVCVGAEKLGSVTVMLKRLVMTQVACFHRKKRIWT